MIGVRVALIAVTLLACQSHDSSSVPQTLEETEARTARLHIFVLEPNESVPLWLWVQPEESWSIITSDDSCLPGLVCPANGPIADGELRAFPEGEPTGTAAAVNVNRRYRRRVVEALQDWLRGHQVSVLELEHADASEIAEILEELLESARKASVVASRDPVRRRTQSWCGPIHEPSPDDTPRFVPADGSFSDGQDALLVVAPADDMPRIEQLIARLDVGRPRRRAQALLRSGR